MLPARPLHRVAFGTLWIVIWIGGLILGLLAVGMLSDRADLVLLGFASTHAFGLLALMLSSLAAGVWLLKLTRRIGFYLLAAVVGGAVTGIVPALTARIGSIRVVEGLETDVIESLNDPVAVDGWSEDGLLLRDGRILPVPGVPRLPRESVMLPHLIASGVEIDPDGQVWGLIRVWHWCGNDPISTHIARVNVAQVLQFVHEVPAPEGQPTAPAWDHCNQVGEYGWNIDCYYAMTHRWGGTEEQPR